MKSGFIQSAIMTFLIIYLTIMSQKAKIGAQNGISMCLNIIIPSLLPMLILINTAVRSKAAVFFENTFGRLIQKIFRLPASCAAAVIFGLIGGYPSGAILTASLFENELIDSKTAGRIMKFNFSGGVAFIITAVGNSFYSSFRAGLILYISTILSSLIICTVTRFTDEYEYDIRFGKKCMPLPFCDAVCSSVNSAVESVLNMCFYIIFFCAAAETFNIPDIISPVIEITGGIFSSKSLPLPLCSAFLSFGGFCIHFQLIPAFGKMHIKYFPFLFYRVFAALVSYIITLIAVDIFPVSVNVFSNLPSNTEKSFYTTTPAVSIIMITGCVVLIYEIKSRKIKLH